MAIFFVGALSAGCATTINSYKPNSASPSEGVLVGKITVLYNGHEFTEHCGVCFNTVNGPCYRLDKSGLVMMNIKAGPTAIRRIGCLDTSNQHYNTRGPSFTVAAGTKNYFGDITFDWQTPGGFKASSMFGLVGAIADESRNDGTLEVHVTDNVTRTTMACDAATGAGGGQPGTQPSSVRDALASDD